jgi:V/A-type H+/Na+-transporting ATPase subunit G/H
MGDESLKRLLEAEAQAELVIARADEERQQVIEKARHEVQVSELQHAERAKEIHASFLAQAEQRAQQTIAELKRRHTEYSAAIRASAQERKRKALDAGIDLIIDSARDGS